MTNHPNRSTALTTGIMERQRNTARSINAQAQILQDAPARRLTCCCCGSSTVGRQWWNRDTGYGLCGKCADWISTRESAAEMRLSYGVPGIHYSVEEK